MNRATLQLVLFVSCAHSLVHIYELSLPSVEQKIAAEFSPDDPASGKKLTGRLSNYWRLMWGLGALAAGWLVDRFGGRRMLAIYLLGCSLMCLVAGQSVTLSALFVAMIGMGGLASIYHPAGLALISHETTPENRPRALGIHGIFGSLGIGAAPFIAGAVLALGFTWRDYYFALAVPGTILGLFFVRSALRERSRVRRGDQPAKPIKDNPQANWTSYFTLTILAMLQGFVYSAVMSFLTRYLSHWQPHWTDASNDSFERYATGAVLFVGVAGQYLAGRLARPQVLERQLAIITLANVPFLLWMAGAEGPWRLVAAGLFALVHFMHQPIYNSLISKYTPPRRRSLCYGFSFAMGLGLGSFGAGFAGSTRDDHLVYSVLAGVAGTAGCVALLLCWLNSRSAA